MRYTIHIFNHLYINFYSFITKPLYYAHNDKSYLVIAVILILLILIFLKKKSLVVLDMNQTDQMRGLAILSIIFLHLGTKVFGPTFPYFQNIMFLDQIGVAMFLILSGFGLMRSYMQRGMQKGYLVHRFSRILLPYMIVTIIWIIFDVVILHMYHAPVNIIKNLFGIILRLNYANDVDPGMWFVTFIMFWYFIFFVVFKIKVANGLKVTMLFVIPIICYLIHDLLLQKNFIFADYWRDFALCFPAGVVLGYYYDNIKIALEKISRLQLAFALSIFIVIGWMLYTMNNIVFFGFVGIAFFTLLSLSNYYSRFLLFIGTISYELYIIHGNLLVKYDPFLFHQPYYISFFVYLAFIVLCAVGLHFLVRRISALLPKLPV